MTSRRTPKPVQIFRSAGVTPLRDRYVPSHKVACPACGAEAGQLCITKTGEPTRSTHRDRRRKAIREGL